MKNKNDRVTITRLSGIFACKSDISINFDFGLERELIVDTPTIYTEAYCYYESGTKCPQP